MKKSSCCLFSVLLCFCLAACADPETASSVAGPGLGQDQSDMASSADGIEDPSADPAGSELCDGHTKTPETGEQKATLTIKGQEWEVILYDTPASRALYDMLPLELAFEDFNGIEKIAYMEQELPAEGAPAAFDPDVGDVCLYAPWGNLAIFCQDFHRSEGLISLGRIDAGMDTIGTMEGEFSGTLEK